MARSEGSSQRFYSVSAQIRDQRSDYCRILEQTQRGTLDLTPWMEWFLGCLARAVDGAPAALVGVIAKTRHWEKLRDMPLNDRQRLVINQMLDGFEGKLTTSKWAAMTKARRIRRCVTSSTSLNAACWCGVRRVGAARATHSRRYRTCPADG